MLGQTESDKLIQAQKLWWWCKIHASISWQSAASFYLLIVFLTDADGTSALVSCTKATCIIETFKALLHHVTWPSWLICLGVGENISLAHLPGFYRLLFLLLAENRNSWEQLLVPKIQIGNGERESLQLKEKWWTVQVSCHARGPDLNLPGEGQGKINFRPVSMSWIYLAQIHTAWPRKNHSKRKKKRCILLDANVGQRMCNLSGQ